MYRVGGIENEGGVHDWNMIVKPTSVITFEVDALVVEFSVDSNDREP